MEAPNHNFGYIKIKFQKKKIIFSLFWLPLVDSPPLIAENTNFENTSSPRYTNIIWIKRTLSRIRQNKISLSHTIWAVVAIKKYDGPPPLEKKFRKIFSTV